VERGGEKQKKPGEPSSLCRVITGVNETRPSQPSLVINNNKQQKPHTSNEKRQRLVRRNAPFALLPLTKSFAQMTVLWYLSLCVLHNNSSTKSVPYHKSAKKHSHILLLFFFFFLKLHYWRRNLLGFERTRSNTNSYAGYVSRFPSPRLLLLPHHNHHHSSF
jgi:hypothetical protein